MVRVLLTSADQVEGDTIVFLDSETIHHFDVVRVELGEEVEALDGKGKLYRGSVIEVKEKRVVVKVFEVREFSPLSPRIVLGVSLLSASRFDEVLDKVAEFGVDEVIPMICERTTVRIKEGELKSRWIRRLSQVSRSVGMPFLPRIQGVQRFPDVIRTFAQKDLRIYIPHLRAKDNFLTDLLSLYSAGEFFCRDILVLIGPEGDFTPSEVNLAREAGAKEVSLGRFVLRVETAVGFSIGLIHAVRSMKN